MPAVYLHPDTVTSNGLVAGAAPLMDAAFGDGIPRTVEFGSIVLRPELTSSVDVAAAQAAVAALVGGEPPQVWTSGDSADATSLRSLSGTVQITLLLAFLLLLAALFIGAAIAARERNLQLHTLGFSRQLRIQPGIARNLVLLVPSALAGTAVGWGASRVFFAAISFPVLAGPDAAFLGLAAGAVLAVVVPWTVRDLPRA